MSFLLDRLRSLSAAEDFFTALHVPYDPAVLHVARLHILRRMGQYLSAESLASMSEDAAEEAARATLARAYQDFITSSPLEQRVFKILKEAVSPKGSAFFPLSDLAVED